MTKRTSRNICFEHLNMCSSVSLKSQLFLLIKKLYIYIINHCRNSIMFEGKKKKQNNDKLKMNFKRPVQGIFIPTEISKQ